MPAYMSLKGRGGQSVIAYIGGLFNNTTGVEGGVDGGKPTGFTWFVHGFDSYLGHLTQV